MNIFQFEYGRETSSNITILKKRNIFLETKLLTFGGNCRIDEESGGNGKEKQKANRGFGMEIEFHL